MEFATPTFNVLNALEQMGYKVVTSGAFVTGHNKFDQVRSMAQPALYWPLVISLQGSAKRWSPGCVNVGRRQKW